MEEKNLMTTKELAEMLRIAPQTLEKARSTGFGFNIPFIRFGRIVRYERAAVAKWMDENGEKGE